MGSFITPDPAKDGLNHYAYCNANPIKYTDPTGLISESEAQEQYETEYGDEASSGVSFGDWAGDITSTLSTPSSEDEEENDDNRTPIEKFNDWVNSLPHKQEEYKEDAQRHANYYDMFGHIPAEWINPQEIGYLAEFMGEEKFQEWFNSITKSHNFNFDDVKIDIEVREYPKPKGKNNIGIHIDFEKNPELKKGSLIDPWTVALMAKEVFKNQEGRDLNISTPSLAYEIWVHANLYDKGLFEKSTKAADCGEKDRERWYWDANTYGIPDNRESFYDEMKDIIK